MRKLLRKLEVGLNKMAEKDRQAGFDDAMEYQQNLGWMRSCSFLMNMAYIHRLGNAREIIDFCIDSFNKKYDSATSIECIYDISPLVTNKMKEEFDRSSKSLLEKMK